jgi:serine phosphatase RsbU (regulator of sigma subunit)
MVNKLEDMRHAGLQVFPSEPDWEISVNEPEEIPRVGDRRKGEQWTPWLARIGPVPTGCRSPLEDSAVIGTGSREDSVTAPNRNPNFVPAPAASSRALSEQLAALRRDHEGLHREFSEAAQVQRRLSPPCRLQRGLFDIAGEIFPVRHLSGDFLTVSDEGLQTVLGIGDIAGKGGSAGMWFTLMVGLVRVLAGSLKDPAEVAARINSYLVALQPEAPITSLFLTWADAETGELTYCNAGHPVPLVLRRDGSVEFLGAGGPVLGAISDAAFVTGRATLNPGDALLGYSDGILECENAWGEQFGLDRLVNATRSGACGPSASALLFSVLGAAQDFAAGKARTDDLALMVVHRLG